MSAPAPPILITDAADERIAVFTALKERDRIGRHGVFIAEGATVLAVLLNSALETLSILVEDKRATRLPILQQRGAAPLYVAPQEVLDSIAGYHLHRGILAAGRIPPRITLDALPHGPLRLPVLVGLSNHDNVGGIYRNAAAFGATAVAVDSGTADPFYRKAIRVGAGAPLRLPTMGTGRLPDFISALEAKGITPYALTPNAPPLSPATPLAPRAAFLFGTEGPGLPQSVISRATPLSLAMAPGVDSLNVATTSGIVLNAHAARHGIGTASRIAPCPAPAYPSPSTSGAL